MYGINTDCDKEFIRMNLVVGGAFQGKLSFAKEHFGQLDGWVDGCECTKNELLRCKGVFHFHEYIRRMLVEGEDVDLLPNEMLEKNPDCIVVSNELGYGVVPVEAFDRRYREKVGRICTRLATFSDKVYRVVCGRGQVIKDD